MISLNEQMNDLIDNMVDSGIFFDKACKEFEKRFISSVLDKYDGHRLKAAKHLGIHRNTLNNKIKKYGL